ncbi:hypothetical protein ACVR0O_02630 [Streptococcus caviae]|uniref:hypothetical protein n=1 Tax=Streptococcus sp. 'caviae' TaxID=1915004 RepID=UPI00094BADDB|nr:hypothetical protein [Streptococcus sp. 'caviae']OLN83886.1 hypothetical protein BMI76_04185 [Streptococcus sp. 'caviae']
MLLKNFNFYEIQLVDYPKLFSDDLMDASSDKVYFAGTNTAFSRLTDVFHDVSDRAEDISDYLTMGYTNLTVYKRNFSVSDDGSMSKFTKHCTAYFIIFKRKNRYFTIFQKGCPQKLDSLISQYLAKSANSENLKSELISLLQQIKKEVSADKLTVIGFEELKSYFWH